MNWNLIKYLSGLLLFAAAAFPAHSQDRIYRLDAGIMGGTSFYLGDANPSTPFHRAQPAFGVQIRRALSPRYAIRLHFMQGSVEADTRDFKNKFPDGQQASFKKNLWDLGAQLEFNFLNYGLPRYIHESSVFSPYIFVGLGAVGYSDDGITGSSTAALNLPFGVGFKYKIIPRVNLIASWSMHKLLTDDFDTTRNNHLLNDPYNFGVQGSWKNADWYSFAMLALTFDMFPNKYCK